MTAAMSEIDNFHRANAGVPRSLELQAVIDEITAGWDFDQIAATAREGVAEYDAGLIRESIAEHGLSVTTEGCETALIAYCRERVEAASQIAIDVAIETENGDRFTAALEGDVVTICRNDVWSGTGRWDPLQPVKGTDGVITHWDGGHIIDCPADLGDDVYDALDEAIQEAIGEREVVAA